MSKDKKTFLDSEAFFGFEVRGTPFSTNTWAVVGLASDDSYYLGYYETKDKAVDALRDILEGIKNDTKVVELDN